MFVRVAVLVGVAVAVSVGVEVEVLDAVELTVGAPAAGITPVRFSAYNPWVPA